MDDQDTEFYYNRAIISTQLGNVRTAIDDLNKCIGLGSKRWEVYDFLAQNYINLSDLNKALTAASKAIEINPNIAAVYNTRGLIFERMGRKRSAKADFYKSAKLNGFKNERSFLGSKDIFYDHTPDEIQAELNRCKQNNYDSCVKYYGMIKESKRKSVDGRSIWRKICSHSDFRCFDGSNLNEVEVEKLHAQGYLDVQTVTSIENGKIGGYRIMRSPPGK